MDGYTAQYVKVWFCLVRSKMAPLGLVMLSSVLLAGVWAAGKLFSSFSIISSIWMNLGRLKVEIEMYLLLLKQSKRDR